MKKIKSKTKLMYLGETCEGRDNNLNLLRMVLATLVLVSHSFALSTGKPSDEPLVDQVGFSLGTLAVDQFFLISGFLVTASIQRSRNVLTFLIGRAVRIFPGLLVMLCITVFILAPINSTKTITSYLSSREAYTYFFKNLLVLPGIEYRLPGVFENNPYRGAVNGSLWTLPLEIKMYLSLAILWLIFNFLRVGKGRFFDYSIRLIALGLGFCGIYFLGVKELEMPYIRLGMMFYFGGAIYSIRNMLPLDRRIFLSIIIALLVASEYSNKVFAIAYFTFAPYAVFYLAFALTGAIQEYNRLGDYSYGMYIYAFPTQQLITSLCRNISPAELMISSFAVTICLAILSWHFVEKHAIESRRSAIDFFRSLAKKI